MSEKVTFSPFHVETVVFHRDGLLLNGVAPATGFWVRLSPQVGYVRFELIPGSKSAFRAAELLPAHQPAPSPLVSLQGVLWRRQEAGAVPQAIGIYQEVGDLLIRSSEQSGPLEGGGMKNDDMTSESLKKLLETMQRVAVRHDADLHKAVSLLPLEVELHSPNEYRRGVLACLSYLYVLICDTPEGRQAVLDLGLQPLFKDVERPGHGGAND